MSRTPREVFESHREALETMNLEQLAADYAEDAILLTLDGAFHGRTTILNSFFAAAIPQYPGLKINFEKLAVEDDVVLLQWSGEADNAKFPRGTAVFIIQDGLIQRQGEWFEVVPKQG